MCRAPCKLSFNKFDLDLDFREKLHTAFPDEFEALHAEKRRNDQIYVKDPHQWLTETESHLDFLKYHEITADQRARMVDWMIEVMTNFS